REGLEVAPIHPLGMLAEDMNQRIIQMRCVLHGSLPCKSVSQGSILTSQGNQGGHASLLSVNQQPGDKLVGMPAHVRGLIGWRRQTEVQSWKGVQIVRISVSYFQQQKAKSLPIVMLTAYDATTARIAEQAGIQVLLVGDTLGMVVQGHDTTVPVTLDE